MNDFDVAKVEALSLRPTAERPEDDRNPATMPEASLYKEAFTLSPLDAEELAIFKAQFITLLATPGSEERKLMIDRLSAYVIAIRAIKHELNGIKFRGLNPEDTELGFGHIRPQFMRANAAYRTTWSQALTTSWADWLYETAGNAFTVGKDFGLCITHLKSLVTPEPFMSEARFETGRTGILIPVDTRGLRVGDTENGVSIIPIPTVIAKPKSSLYGRARSDASGTDEVTVSGLVVGLGRVLKEETATWTA